MNKKAIFAIIAVAVIIIGAGTGYALTKGKPKAPEPGSTPVSQSAATEQTSASTTALADSQSITAETTTESTTASTTAAVADYSFLTKNVWYYFDEEKRCAWAFKFDGDDDVAITYFNSDNIDGEDAKTSSGEGDYDIMDGKLTVDDIPSVIEADSFTFIIDGKELKDEKGNKLETNDKVSLDFAYRHFN